MWVTESKFGVAVKALKERIRGVYTALGRTKEEILAKVGVVEEKLENAQRSLEGRLDEHFDGLGASGRPVSKWKTGGRCLAGPNENPWAGNIRQISEEFATRMANLLSLLSSISVPTAASFLLSFYQISLPPIPFLKKKVVRKEPNTELYWRPYRFLSRGICGCLPRPLAVP